jgi:murein DD-endopeptidase MepM/ murein hydrolase activator NlpD
LTLAALKASLARWERIYARRVKRRTKARQDLLDAGSRPPAVLLKTKILREQQAEEARKKVALRKQQIKARYVASPLDVILDDAWGYHPPVHDGLDLICEPNAPLRAICRARVIRADAAGWWGKGAHASSGHPVSDGDGIIVIRSLVDFGPFRRGQNLCYGHAEHAVVKPGDVVSPGQVIGRAGFANAWHTHFMVNGRSDDRGLGDRDPRPFVDFARGKT